jgi:hypothetical protein
MKKTKTILITQRMLDKAQQTEQQRPHAPGYCGRCIIAHAINRAYRYKVGGDHVEVGFWSVTVTPKYGPTQKWNLDDTGYGIRADFDGNRFEKIREMLPVKVVLTRVP